MIWVVVVLFEIINFDIFDGVWVVFVGIWCLIVCNVLREFSWIDFFVLCVFVCCYNLVVDFIFFVVFIGVIYLFELDIVLVFGWVIGGRVGCVGDILVDFWWVEVVCVIIWVVKWLRRCVIEKVNMIVVVENSFDVNVCVIVWDGVSG